MTTNGNCKKAWVRGIGMLDGWDRLWVRGELRARREEDLSLGKEWEVGC